MGSVRGQTSGGVWIRGRNVAVGGFLVGLLLGHGVTAAPVGAASPLTWRGPAAAGWSSPGSWSPARTPGPGDSLSFGRSPGLLSSSVDDVPSLALAGITLDGRWSIEPAPGGTGPLAVLTGPIVAALNAAPAPRRAQYRLPTALASDVAVSVAPADAVLVYGGRTEGPHTLTALGPGTV